MASFLKRFFRRSAFLKRYDIINYFIRTRNYRDYLEIGTSSGRCIARVSCAHKDGVDPRPRGAGEDWTLHEVTSDAFFLGTSREFDIIFIDGLHRAEQVLTDVFNSAAALRPGGVILLHDCNPQTEEVQLRDHDPRKGYGWNGDVWKAIVFIRQHVPQLFCRVIERDQGIGLVFPRDQQKLPPYTPELQTAAAAFFESLTWKDLEAHRQELLGLIHGREHLEAELQRENHEGSA